MSGGANSFIISSTVQELWFFENSLKLAKNAKITDSSEILIFFLVQTNEFWLTLIHELDKTNKILKFWKNWESENAFFRFWVHLKVRKFYTFQKMLTFGARKTRIIRFFFFANFSALKLYRTGSRLIFFVGFFKTFSFGSY